MDQLACMRIFVRVVEHGAFVRAADNLSMSRASVTTAVAQLEQHLGVRLLNRTTRRLGLTEEGRAFYQDCVRILGEIAEAEDNLSSVRAQPRGRLRVSVAQSFVHLAFFSKLAQFMASYPDLSVDVVITDRLVNLVEEGIDCALRSGRIPADADLVARKLTSVRWLTCAAPSYLAGPGTPARIEDLRRHDCIQFVSPSTRRGCDWQFDDNGKLVAFTPRGRLRLTSLDATISAAIAGLGVAYVPEPLVHGAILSGQLQAFLTEHSLEALPLTLVYPGNRYLPAKVRAFAEFFEKAYPQEGAWPSIAAAMEQGKTGTGDAQ
ncbi:LysR family transcriptional regulator [Pseudomonas sp. MBLB4123]|uniref:LysR family transcriptional regulator n=1 Tax=Pseudomonas sp. MBLB4123 TaxID=3451557 RepID=UPI003F755AF1